MIKVTLCTVNNLLDGSAQINRFLLSFMIPAWAEKSGKSIIVTSGRKLGALKCTVSFKSSAFTRS